MAVAPACLLLLLPPIHHSRPILQRLRQVLRRYLAQTTEDIAQAHRLGSPVDNKRPRY